MSTFQEMAERLRNAECGRGTRIPTPFGPRLLHPADGTATGHHLDFVERWVDALRPLYANTHTAVSTTGRVMNGLREQARAVISRSVNAGPEDVVLFTGSGATAAVNKLVGLLGLRIPEPLEREFRLTSHVPPERRPVVLVGPYEHHSNVLPWMETVADVQEVALDSRGGIDLDDLRRRARAARGRPLVAGAFSAASNVDGLLTDVAAAARVLHEEGALAFVDYAAGGPYLPIDMHPADPLSRLDAVFVSTHKFPGGPEGSGVLVAHRDLFRTRTPERPGGGTVDYVSGCRRDQVDYVRHLSEREEGGTPDIVGDLRAGVAFALKDHAGAAAIRDHDVALARAAVERLSRHPRIRVYGPLDAPRLPILSFNVDGLHHDLVSALLDHLFGIQNRAGCSCAGPYGHRLLGIEGERSERYRRLIAGGVLGAKPGWVRVSLPWYAAPEDAEFTLRAVEFVASRGEAFVPLYRLDWRDGVWRHREGEVADPAPTRLTAGSVLAGPSPVQAPVPPSPAERGAERARYLEEAGRIADALERRWKGEPPTWNRPTGRADVDALVWFRYVETEGMPS
jgi:selenocysteine lyase/cysteine desulfurase